MKFPNLKMWFRWQKRLWAARDWLSANNPDAIAAYCMYHLNHYARHRAGHKGYFYALKNQLVQHFCQAGLCVSLTQQVQTLPCWSCNGIGIDEWNDGDTCWKCGGTGIYRRHYLYRFVFRISGRSYVWHQPVALVTWPVELTSDEQGEYKERDVPDTVSAGITTEIVELYYATVYLYLQRRGYPEPSPTAATRLRSALYSDWWKLVPGSQRMYRLRRKWRDARLWLHDAHRAVRPAVARAQVTGNDVPPGFIEESEIPF